MKKFFFFAVAALALAACSNDETVEVNQGDAINFRPLMNNATRASATSDVTTANINSFNVTAFNAGTTANPYINDVTYTKNSEAFYVGGSTTATDNYYWPINNLDFYAYAYTDAGASLDPAAPQVSKTDYHTFVVTPTAGANPTQVDLVYACLQDAAKATYGASGVPLNFRHTGSKIALKVKNTSAKMKFDIDGWKVGFLAPSGTFTFPITSGNSTTGNNTDDGSGSVLGTTIWSSLGTPSVATEYSSTFSTTYVAANTATASALSGEFILIPQSFTAATQYASSAANTALNNTYIAVKLIIRNTDNATDGQGTIIACDWTDSDSDGILDEVEKSSVTSMWAIWPINGTWKPGYKYTYTLDLADGGYYEKNHDTNEDLDPILENAIIKFVTVTVDAWDTDTNDDGTANDETPVPVLP